MFSLDEAVADWRRQLAASCVKAAKVLDELESHLRDDVAEQMQSGLSAEASFQFAATQLGHAAILQDEFAKLRRFPATWEGLKHLVLTMAGVPSYSHHDPMNPSDSKLIEPGWATYLKSTAFIVPAVSLWTLTAVFVLPRLEQICADAGLPLNHSVWNVTHSNFAAMVLFREYGLFLAGAIILLLVLLEWRSSKWPRYRRAILGIGTFAFNSLVLISIFLMIITAVVAAPALLQHAR
jgi:hypothetical protein